MTKKEKKHLDTLYRELKFMEKLMAMLAKKNASKKVTDIIRIRPGWTTPAELKFAEGLAQSINQQLTNVGNDMDALVKASGLVE